MFGWPGRVTFATLAVLGAAGCGASGGAGTFIPVQTGGAAGTVCIAESQGEGCLPAGNARMQCDPQTSVWKELQVCNDGTYCVETFDPSTQKKTTECRSVAAANDASGDGGAGADANGSDAAGGADAGGSDGASADTGAADGTVGDVAVGDGGTDAQADATGADAGTPPQIPVETPQIDEVNVDISSIATPKVACPNNGKPAAVQGGVAVVSFLGSGASAVPHGPYKRVTGGTTIIEGCFINGERRGDWTWWHEGGQNVAATAYFDENGELHGPYRSWHANGAEQVVAVMNHGKAVGAYIRRYEDGSLELRAPFDEQGRLHGRRELRWPNGQLREETFYAAGGPLGSGRTWAENGQLTYHGNYKATLHQGPHAWWNEDGDLLGVALFDKGDALIELTHPNGQTITKGAMKAGERDGSWKSWTADGTLVFDGIYGQQGASIKRYFDNGILYETATYDADRLLDGPYLRNDATGNKEREGSYAANLLEGDWIFYQESKGQLLCFRRSMLVWIGSCATIPSN